ncbi:hypothetical protein ILUMI_01997 [Ignelater luminosus]|uniref:Uncharacterized protein n=1 Tax=Ignelater luminosus TaxID=2038154 RepID=A0A8K0DJ30_IGNLU|nr:hypothetical protein ILUMI_01997 [Ignelater luminosus]
MSLVFIATATKKCARENKNEVNFAEIYICPSYQNSPEGRELILQAIDLTNEDNYLQQVCEKRETLREYIIKTSKKRKRRHQTNDVKDDKNYGLNAEQALPDLLEEEFLRAKKRKRRN